MGLDLVEIMINVEEEFGIDILEDAARKIETVGDIVDYVERQIRENDVPQWKAEQVYAEFLVRIKNELASALKISESQIDPNDRLDKLIPRKRRREIWRLYPFFSEIGSLSLSCNQCVLIAVTSFIAGTPFFVAGRKLFGDNDFGAIIGCIASIITIITLFVFLFLLLPRTVIDSKAKTVSDCARLFAAKNGVRLNWEGKNWTCEQIELRVRQIISDVGGFKLEDLRLEHKLYDDLWLG